MKTIKQISQQEIEALCIKYISDMGYKIVNCSFMQSTIQDEDTVVFEAEVEEAGAIEDGKEEKTGRPSEKHA